MTCAQCGLPIGDRWYRTKLDDGTYWHTDCQMGMWRSMNDLERGRQLVKYGRLEMPTGRWPKNLGLPGRVS